MGRERYETATFLNRCVINGTYFDSPVYKRPRMGNCYVSFDESGIEKFGEMEYFVRIAGSPFYNKVHANVLFFSAVQSFGLVKGFFIRFNERMMRV